MLFKMSIFGKISLRGLFKGIFFSVVFIFACIGAWNLASKGVKSVASLSSQDFASEESEEQTAPLKKKETQYSFYKDKDRDGLTNGWEYVFGTDKKDPDTDGDGYSDKKEAKDGFDPLVEGEAKLEERKAENISIDYYGWAQKKGINEPTLEFSSRIREFAQSKDLLKLKQVPPSFLKVDSNESKQAYLKKLQSVPLPRAAFDYQTLASGYRSDNQAVEKKLQDLLTRIEVALTGAKRIKPPPEAKKIHKKHLKVLVNFRAFLKDLKKARRDPVQIKINLLRSGELLKEAFEAEQLKQDISS